MNEIATATEDKDLRQSAWACARQRKSMDSETLIYLRVCLNDAFEYAHDWNVLRDMLRDRGFEMMPRDGRLRLLDLHSKEEICTFGSLGHPRVELEKRFGRLH